MDRTEGSVDSAEKSVGGNPSKNIPRCSAGADVAKMVCRATLVPLVSCDPGLHFVDSRDIGVLGR